MAKLPRPATIDMTKSESLRWIQQQFRERILTLAPDDPERIELETLVKELDNLAALREIREAPDNLN